MKKLHLILGLSVIVIFLLTGQYMEYVGNPKLPDGERMMYRSRHIYLLLAGLLNLGIGLYFSYRSRGWRRTIQIIGSVLLVISPALLLAGFFYEPNRGPDQTLIAPIGIYAVAAGTMLHLISSIPQSDKKSMGAKGVEPER